MLSKINAMFSEYCVVFFADYLVYNWINQEVKAYSLNKLESKSSYGVLYILFQHSRELRTKHCEVLFVLFRKGTKYILVII